MPCPREWSLDFGQGATGPMRDNVRFERNRATSYGRDRRGATGMSSIQEMRNMSRALCLVIVVSMVAAAVVRPAWADEKGAKLFRAKCGSCHTAEKGKHRVGPSLFGVYGRKAGTAEGFKQYVGLKDAKFAWDEAMLEQYLADPDKFVKARGASRSGMAFKLPKAEERQAVIAYLKEAK